MNRASCAANGSSASPATVTARGASLVNPKLPTGEIEVRVKELEVLSISPTPPFTPDEHETVCEEKRLAYRYLDLRRAGDAADPAHAVSRDQDHARLSGRSGFWEIETPFLTKSTPEGARDFIVPSRLMPGSFYALPQSPQLFKQLLMVGGCDKYMQIVRCFRDEDPRADRQAEFTQLDVEMSFIDRENIIAIMEGLLRRIWKEILGKEIPNPIPHMEYDEAMSHYGSDRPDLRFGMELHDITDLASRPISASSKTPPMVKAIVVPGGGKLSRKETDALAEWAKGFGAKGLAVTKVTATRPRHRRRQIPRTDRRETDRAHRRQGRRSALLRRRQAENRPQGSRRTSPEDGPRSETRRHRRNSPGSGWSISRV